MMEVLMLWLASIIACFIVEIKNELRIFKDAADIGYKFKKDRAVKLTKHLRSDNVRVQWLGMLTF